MSTEELAVSPDTRRVIAGRYQVGELLGRGGMSDVHKGIDSRLGRTVAIKLLKPQLATDPAFRTRFRQEAQAAARMAHPTIVRVFDAGEDTVRDANGNEVQAPFIIMEYVEARPSTSWSRAGRSIPCTRSASPKASSPPSSTRIAPASSTATSSPPTS
jgi:serine/threonine-protein kinase